jgi:cytoskeletal protein CcmA (bactofilin family)
VRARSWLLRGQAKVTGSVELDALSVIGDLSVAGAARVDRWESQGRVTVLGEANGTGAWTLSGEQRFGSALTTGSLRSKGRLDVHGALQLQQELSIEGSLDVEGDVTAPTLSWNGAVSISGTVAARSVTATIRGDSKVARIRADRVVVHRASSPFYREPPTLDVLEIEAQEVQLAGVVAQFIRAAKITVGPGCRVSEVDGTVVSVDRGSHVGPQVKSTKWHGLTR